MRHRLLLAAVMLFCVAGPVQAATFYMTDDLIQVAENPSIFAPHCKDEHTYAMGDMAADGKMYIGFSSSAITCRTYMSMALDEPLQVVEGTGTITLFIGCDTASTGFPDGTFSTHQLRLVIDGTVVADTGQVGGTGTPACTGSSDIIEISEAIDLEAATLPAGTEVVVDMFLWYNNPPSAAADNLHVLVGPTHPSRVELPSLAAEPEVPTVVHVWEDVEAVDVNHQFVNPRHAVYHYNWTAGPEEHDLAWASNATAGSASLVVTDPAGNEVVNATGPTTQLLPGAEGVWKLAITYDGFVGDASLQIQPRAVEGGSPDPEPSQPGAMPPASEEAPPAAGNGTPEEDPPAGKDSPAPLLFWLPLAAAALRRR